MALFCALAAVACAPSLARALTTHLPDGEDFPEGVFCESGTGPGSEVDCQPSFERPAKLAVDQASGDLLVADLLAGTVSRYHADGAPAAFPALGGNKIEGLVGFNAGIPAFNEIAVDNSCALHEPPLNEATTPSCADAFPTNGNIYVTQVTEEKVRIFSREGVHLGDLTAAGITPFGSRVCGVGVDGAGAVYVATGFVDDRIHKFVASGDHPTDADATTSFLVNSGGPPQGNPCSLALGAGSTAGFLFFVEAVANGAGPVWKLDIDGAGEGEVKYKVADQAGAARPADAALDPATGHVYTTRGEEVLEYDASGAATSLVSAIRPVAGSGVDGSAIEGASGKLYTALSAQSNLRVFGPTVTVPTATTEAASEVTGTSATLQGTVDPDGQKVTDCFFQYGPSNSYGEEIECGEYEEGGTWHTFSSPSELGEGHGAIPVRAELAGLETNATQHFRLLAPGEEGSVPGGDRSFTTLNPFVIEAAGEVSDVTATLNGKVNPFGSEVAACEFEYGPSTAYGHTATCVGAIPTDEAEHPVSAAIEGLVPNGAVYHFRGRVEFSGGEVIHSADETFETGLSTVSEAASAITRQSATLNGRVTPWEKPLDQCFFEWGTSTSYGHSAECDPKAGDIPADSGEHPVAAPLSGLNAGTTYHFRLVTVDHCHPATPAEECLAHGHDIEFTTPGARIAATWSESVGFDEATLKALIDPEGAATSYRFEYDTAPYGEGEAAHGTSVPVPDGFAGEDSEAHLLAETIEGLAPGTSYHYRAVATSECEAGALCVDHGPDRTLLTYSPLGADGCPNAAYRSGPGAGLPDCRAYEMVSPVDKNGGDVVAPPGKTETPLSQAAGGGAALTYATASAFAGAKSGKYFNQYLSRRGGDGWSTEALNAPQGKTVFDPRFGVPFDLEPAFQAFTPDLCGALLRDDNLTPLDPRAIAGYTNAYLRDNCGAGAGSYEAVTVGDPPLSSFDAADLFLDTRAYAAGRGRTLFTAYAQLAPDAAPTTSGGLLLHQIYEYDGSGDRLVSVLPGGAASSLNSTLGTGDQRDEANVERAVSGDGSVVYWTASTAPNEGGPGTIYARVGGTETVPVSEAATGVKSSFLTASADGSRAVFRVDGFPFEGDLYEFDLAKALASGEPEAPDAAAATLIAGEVGGEVGSSEDLSRLYFTSEEALAAGAKPGGWNLYLREGGAVRLVARLADADQGLNGTVDTDKRNTHRSRTTADGRHMAFMSSSPALAEEVAGYDNADASSGEADAELYLYDAGTGKLACASCNPAGARPAGRALNESIRAAAWLDGWKSPVYPGRALSADGSRLFFNSFDALLPADRNEAQDVYEWEAPGAGDCTTASPRYHAANGGCLGLISTGHSSSGSEFVDASADGSDVFIRTASSIDPRDPGLIDIYDAREGGGFPPPPPAAPECAGDACQSVPAPPAARAPSSSGFHGPGNKAEGAAGRCTRVARRAKAFGRRARLLRRNAGRLARNGKRTKAQGLGRKARRFARAARRQSGHAKRCRARAGRRAAR